MNILKIIRVSLMALARNKMRSFLTALGIIIGVGAVIAMASIGQGAKVAVEKQFKSLGTNLLFVRPGSRSFRGRHGGSGTFANLMPEDAIAIEEKCDAVQHVSPNVSGRAQVVFRNKNWNTSLQGVGAKYPEVRNSKIVDGVFFDENMVKSAQKVCVLGSEVNENLFEGEDAIGQIIRIKKIPFRVIGVLKSRGESGWFNRDDIICMPYTTAQRRLLGIKHIQSIDVSATSMSETAAAQEQIEELMRIRHKIAPGAEDDFNVGNLSDIAEGAAESTETMTLLLAGIAFVSLIVGGIGIMNIMLVSVTERTREIGIRMSVGAREKDILFQFLTEAIVLSILGGVIGIGVGIAGSRPISRIFASTAITPIFWVVIAFCVSASIGIIFGFFPAWKASRLDPIEALRYE